MRVPIDVVYCDADLVVIRVITMRPNRLGLPVRAARQIVEVAAGNGSRWGVRPGDQLEVKGDEG
jgi:hypothetical protein